MDKTEIEKFINPYKMFVGNFVPNWLACRPEVSDGAKLTYARLCRFAGKDGNCYPSIETLAIELGRSVATINRHLKELKDHKLIDAERKGLGYNNSYKFLNHAWINADMIFPDVSDVIDQDISNMIDQDVSDVIDHSIKENHINNNHIKENQEIVPPLKNKDIDICENVKDLWNVFAHDNGLSQIIKLDTSRKAKIRKRLAEQSFNLLDILEKIKQSGFLLGANERGWRVDFDFIFNSDHNYLKILENKYQNGNGVNKPRRNTLQDFS